MKKSITLLIIICLTGMLIGGCGKEKKKEEEKKPITIYEQLTIKDTPLSDDDSNVIANGINNWVKGFLAVNSTDKDKELADKILYQSVTSEKQRKVLKSDRDIFYGSGVVVVDEATTVLTDTKQAEYEKENVGVVSCETTIRGTVSGTAFEKKYTMQMVVKRGENETVTVYEINDIAWE